MYPYVMHFIHDTFMFVICLFWSLLVDLPMFFFVDKVTKNETFIKIKIGHYTFIYIKMTFFPTFIFDFF